MPTLFWLSRSLTELHALLAVFASRVGGIRLSLLALLRGLIGHIFYHPHTPRPSHFSTAGFEAFVHCKDLKQSFGVSTQRAAYLKVRKKRTNNKGRNCLWIRVCLRCVHVSVCVFAYGSYTCVFSYSLPAPPLANDRCNKAFVKDETIHHVVQGTIKTPAGLKAQTRVPLNRAWRDRGRVGAGGN